MFKPIKNETIHQRVVNQIRNAIQTGEIAPGERLPSERALAEIFSVSRASVREAISALEAVGTIEIRKGSGAFVAETTDLTDLFGKFLTEEDIGPDEIREARAVIECGIAGITAQKANAAFRKTLREYAAKGRAALEKNDLRDLAEIHKRFFKALVMATGNEAIIKVMDLLEQIPVRDDCIRQPYRDFERTDWAMIQQDQLEAIVDAIIAGDAKLATEKTRIKLKWAWAESGENTGEEVNAGNK